MSPRRKADETCGTATLFDIEQAAAGMRSEVKPVAIKSVAQAYCPECKRVDGKGNRKKTGLIRVGRHLVWRAHGVVTWSGARRPCHASTVAVCDLPPKVKPMVECPCARTGLPAA
jgi:hypothetical protein